jgi:hypothetical protein
MCLGPCPVGKFLDGFNIIGANVAASGTCKPCDQRFYKPNVGNYDTKCTRMTTCPAGEEKRWLLESLKTKSDGSCVPCQKGFYKPSSPSRDPLATCTRCPQFSITTSEGSDDEGDCRCDNIQRYQNPVSATIDCIYADSCGISPGPCVAGASCAFSESCGTTCTCPPFHYGNGFGIGRDVFDVFYGALTGSGCVLSGSNVTSICDDGFFGAQCQYKMPTSTGVDPVSDVVQDEDSDGVVDGFSLAVIYQGQTVASLTGQAGFLPASHVGTTKIEILLFTRQDLDSLNPGLAPDPAWLQSNLLKTDPRYVCAPTSTALSADFILKLIPAGTNFLIPVELGLDAAGVPASDPPRYKHVMLFNETAHTWTPIGQPTLSDRVSAALAHFSLYSSGAGAEVPVPTTSPAVINTTPPPVEPAPPPAPIPSAPQPADSSGTVGTSDPGISTGALIAAVGLPLLFLIGVALFIFRYKIFQNTPKTVQDPVVGEVGIMTLPLIEHDPHTDDQGETSMDLPAIEDQGAPDSGVSLPPALPAPPEDPAQAILAASGINIEEWTACSSCQVHLPPLSRAAWCTVSPPVPDSVLPAESCQNIMAKVPNVQDAPTRLRVRVAPRAGGCNTRATSGIARASKASRRCEISRDFACSAPCHAPGERRCCIRSIFADDGASGLAKQRTFGGTCGIGSGSC